MDLTVLVVSRATQHQRPLTIIRKWCLNSQDSKVGGLADKIDATTIDDAVRIVEERGDKIIVVAVDVSRPKLVPLIEMCKAKNAALIISHGRRQIATPRLPSAALIAPWFYLECDNSENGLTSCLRKSFLRQKAAQQITVSQLEMIGDFPQYFSLRYQTWKQLGYLPPERDAQAVGWELDFSDWASLPIGLFSRETNDLVGCARLVRIPRSDNFVHKTKIQELLDGKNNDILNQNVRYPNGLPQPFDVLESFEGFRELYHQWATQRRSRAEISRVIVKDSLRNQGLGEVLVDSLAWLAQRKGIDVLFLACLERHSSFYSRCHFEEINDLRCDAFHGVNVPAVAMKRSFPLKTLDIRNREQCVMSTS